MTARAREEIRALVIDTLAAIAPEVDIATIAPEKPLRGQVDIDSFDFLNVIIRLHEKLGVDIPEADYGRLATLDGTVDYLVKKCGGAV
jgi:acyl carrier protein